MQMTVADVGCNSVRGKQSTTSHKEKSNKKPPI